MTGPIRADLDIKPVKEFVCDKAAELVRTFTTHRVQYTSERSNEG